MRRRLYLQIYFGFAGLLLLLFVTLGAAAHLLRGDVGPVPPPALAAAELLLEGLPEGEGLPEALAAHAERLSLELTLWDAEHRVVAATGVDAMPPPAAGCANHAWIRTPGRAGIRMELRDGRWLGGTWSTRLIHARMRRFLAILVLLCLVVALASLPLARRITRRLTRLQEGVDALGGGDLSARVPVQGRDEVADLATAFNQAAERIERLVERQRRVLASASHELRSPLARVRMALELVEDRIEDEDGRRYLGGAKDDVGELDQLIGDLLLTARIEADGTLAHVEEVDLRLLLEAEAARIDAAVSGPPCTVRGDPRMIRVLVRNLLENARRHGNGSPVEAIVALQDDGGARLEVSDRGPGVPETEREKIFEPFYRPAGHREGADGGVGLGLALSREIARHHGGDVHHQPRDGGGSTFVVLLGPG